MKKLPILTLFFCALILETNAQRPSPPAETSATVDGIDVTINYSQPAMKGRAFGSDAFVPFGKVWRNGANEATWIEVSDDVKINGETLAKGKYSFYAIPDEDEWTLIFNSTWSQWGTQYDSANDVMKVKAKSGKSEEYSERYTIALNSDGSGSLNWGDFSVAFTVSK